MANTNIPETDALEKGTYEIIRNRMLKQGDVLRERIANLNANRKEVFGAIESKLLATERISTEYNCLPADMIALGETFLFGYNVKMGLKTEAKIEDVFSIYTYNNRTFKQTTLTLIDNAQFKEDYKNLYTYYKNTVFVKFTIKGPFLYFLFRISKNPNDIKAFKWAVSGSTLSYVDNRSEHEIVYPDKYEFVWKRATRDNFVKGKHPHVSIEDRIFVETTEGDLTIKVENNTETGQGIYSEPVDNKEQTLDDSEIYYAIIENLIVLKIKPYQEKDFRYIVYSSKTQNAVRVNSLDDSCVLLPDSHGIIFPNGYFLQTGVYKFFDHGISQMQFKKRIASPNGEDYLFAFYNKAEGKHILLSYNLIEQTVAVPVICNGYAIFNNGEMAYFKTGIEPVKHHAVQIWQTPYVHADFQIPGNTENELYKIGNKDLVRGMAECSELLSLINKEESYRNLYGDIAKKARDIVDSYHWLNSKVTLVLSEPIKEIQTAAELAIDEYEKVSSIRKNTAAETKKHIDAADLIIKKIKTVIPKDTLEYVALLAELRKAKGNVVNLKTLRYTNLQLIADYEAKLDTAIGEFSEACITYLSQPDALVPYEQAVLDLTSESETVKKVVEIEETGNKVQKISTELEMLIEIVSNLKIKDATITASIIEQISAVYSKFNTVKAGIARRRKEMLMLEGKAEFAAQINLFSQSVINHIDLSDTPEKCDENLSKLYVQLEELEGKFSEFDDFVQQIATKRTEVYSAFDARKIQLIEARTKRSENLMQAAGRIVNAVTSRLKRFKTSEEINTYLATDIMLEKFRDIVADLLAIGDTVKADQAESKLKTAKEDAFRNLKDSQELFADGDNLIKLGNHKFTVNKQELGLSMVLKNDEMQYHLSGTGFFEKLNNAEFEAFREFWNQSFISENKEIYRAEYLAAQIFFKLNKTELAKLTDEALLETVRKEMAVRYQEAYTKGVHDLDAFSILKALLQIAEKAELLYFAPEVRANARIFLSLNEGSETVIQLLNRIENLKLLSAIFPNTKEADKIVAFIAPQIHDFNLKTNVFIGVNALQTARYLVEELKKGNRFVLQQKTNHFVLGFKKFLRTSKYETEFENALNGMKENRVAQFENVYTWLYEFATEQQVTETDFILEAAASLFCNKPNEEYTNETELSIKVEKMHGEHALLEGGVYKLNYNAFVQKLSNYIEVTAPKFVAYEELKRSLLHRKETEMRLNEFKPQILSSFVRNKLINEVYLPLVGNNLAKQIGTSGENKRTDRMGMLLLISPPGYGKTTLMEYIAGRLGLIFMKINGPSLGHEITSVDPAKAGNAAAREELKKLNLAFEMGDNVMIYIDDIQHCNPEFLQKFITVADGQRKIEGVYNGISKTYDFRGKKVCVVMAGNPYTETGEKFQIPDMLANRADTYNLGDIIGDTEAAFVMSYVENSLTSNPTLASLASKSQKDLYAFIHMAQTGEQSTETFEASYSAQEVNEYVAVLKKLITIRDTIFAVNKQYIASAAQAEAYRTEPHFKLQGSYRDMNKISEKVVSVMNDQEIQRLLLSHYENESQTLTADTEANMLKFKELTGTLNDKETERWESIKAVFRKNKEGNTQVQMNKLIERITDISTGIQSVSEVLSKK